MGRWILRHKTEATLWLLFLFACAGFGYFQGTRPDFKILEYLLPPTPIQVLTISESFFPTEVVAELEHETHTRIQIRKIQSWSDLQVALIASPSPEILLIPSHWAQTLHQQGLLNPDMDLQKLLPGLLSADFSLPAEGGLKSSFVDFLPVYWAKLGLYQRAADPESIDFLNDSDLLLAYVDELKKSTGERDFLQLRFSLFGLEKWFVSDTSEKDLFLSTHVLAAPHPEWKHAVPYPDAMYILGFALPKNSRHPQKVLKILSHYCSFEVQKPLLELSPFASTLQVIDGSDLPPGKKSSYLRNVEMSRMVWVHSKEKDSEQKARDLIETTFAR